MSLFCIAPFFGKISTQCPSIPIKSKIQNLFSEIFALFLPLLRITKQFSAKGGNMRNREKADLKTPESNRRLEIRPSMQQILEAQRRQTALFQSEYVFLNTKGLPCVQDTLRGHWVKAMEKSGLLFRRMYETRHTFASWALSKGETPEWVARTLGHVDTAMVFNTYSRYIPNMTRRDGSALEEMFAGDVNKKKAARNRHNLRHKD